MTHLSSEVIKFGVAKYAKDSIIPILQIDQHLRIN